MAALETWRAVVRLGRQGHRRQCQHAATITRGKVKFVTMPLNRHDYEEYYRGYANRVLWPLCHERIDLMGYERRSTRPGARQRAVRAQAAAAPGQR
jgi:trehalose-6-phosphate synthase